MDSIYLDIILEHSRNPRNFPIKGKYARRSSGENAACGDTLAMGLNTERGTVSAIAFEGRGCAISVACASLLTVYAKGKTTDELLKLDKDFIIKILGVDLGINRVKCALLPLEILQKLLVK